MGSDTFLIWSDERTEALKALWAAGLSCSQIAAELGHVTRNAVISKVHRLGLSGRAKSPAPRSPRPPKPRAGRMARPASRGNSALALQAYAEPEADPVLNDIAMPQSQRVSLFDLSEANCHWPVGDPISPDFFFCGAHSLDHLPYCAQHARFAYQAPVERVQRNAKRLRSSVEMQFSRTY